jgi:tetratricopeptide (TPR) repeat protein
VRAFDILLDDVQPAAVKAQFDSDWAGRGPLATVAGPDAVAEGAIRQAMAAPAATSGSGREAVVVRADGGVRRTPEQLAQFQRAEAALKAGQLKAAMRDFDDLTHANPRDADAIAGRGRVFVAEGKGDPALKAFAEALAVDPDDVVALNARGSMHVQMNDAEAAITDFDKALAVAPRDDVVLYNRGLAYKQLHRYDRAVRDFDAALRVSPGDALTLAAKADAYRRAGDLLLAQEFYDAALKAQPRLAEALDGRGQVKTDLGDTAGGAADRAKARELDPSLGG